MTSDNKKEPDFFSEQVSEANRFYLDAHSRKHHTLKVVCGGREHCRPNYRIDRRDFPFYSIEFVARGKGSVIKTQNIAFLPEEFFLMDLAYLM